MFILILNIFSKRVPKTTYNLKEQYSLFSPAVDENGISQKWNFFGDYTAVTYSSSETHIRLGYGGNNSTGGLYSKEKFDSDDFRLDFRFNISDLRDGSIAIWITKNQWEDGNFFGRNENLDGMVLIMDFDPKDKKMVNLSYFKGNLLLKAEQRAANITKVPIDYSKNESKLYVRIENKNHNGTVLVGNGISNLKEMFNIKNTELEGGSYIGVSGHNYSTDSNLKLLAIRTSFVVSPSIEQVYNVGEGEKSSFKVWFIFFIACAIIVYIVIPKGVLFIK